MKRWEAYEKGLGWGCRKLLFFPPFFFCVLKIHENSTFCLPFFISILVWVLRRARFYWKGFTWKRSFRSPDGKIIFWEQWFLSPQHFLGNGSFWEQFFGNLRDNMTNLNVGGFRKNTPRVVDLKKSRYWRRFRRFDEIATKNSPWSYILLYTIYMVLSKSARPFLFSGVHFFSGFGHSKEDFIRFMSRFRKRSCWRHWRRNHASASLTELQFLFRDCSGAV